MRSLITTSLLILATLSLSSCKKKSPYDHAIEIEPIERVEESDNASVDILGVDRDGIHIRTRGAALGEVESYGAFRKRSKKFARAYRDGRELPDGRSLRIVIDGNQYFLANHHQSERANVETRSPYYESYVRIPNHKGTHFEAFLIHSYGESYKSDNTYSFYSNTKASSPSPHLIYNFPEPNAHYKAGKPILIDYYLVDPQSVAGVAIYIDGHKYHTSFEWTPALIYGLSAGEHEITLELVNQRNKRLKRVTQRFYVD